MQALPEDTVAVSSNLARFEEIARLVPNNVEQIMGAPVIRTLIKQVGETRIKLLLEVELVKLASRMNVANNLTDAQVPFIAEELLKIYPTETLADMILVFRRGAIGHYGKVYHQLDASVIFEWMQKHIEEKAMYHERDNANAKEAGKYNDKITSEEFYKEYKLRLERERSANESRRKAEFEAKKAVASSFEEYRPMTAEQLRARELHSQYLSAKWKHDQEQELQVNKIPFIEEDVWTHLQNQP